MKFSHLSPPFCALLLALLCACSSNREARTPREFVEKYSKAWRNGDVEVILAMRSRKEVVDIDLKPNMKEVLKEASLADERDEVEQSIKRRDFEYLAWANSEFDSAREHGDHFHVGVRVAGSPSDIVLVREGDVLRIHPNPSVVQ